MSIQDLIRIRNSLIVLLAGCILIAGGSYLGWKMSGKNGAAIGGLASAIAAMIIPVVVKGVSKND